jgi:hypothetical protein
VVHPKATSSSHAEDTLPQNTILALPPMIEHHAIVIINANNKNHLVVLLCDAQSI